MSVIKTIDHKFYRALGEQLRKIRTEKSLSLRELAKMTGFSRTLIDYWELGVLRIKPEQFERLCEELEISSNIKIDIKIGL